MSPTGVERRFSLDSNILVVAADQDAGANRHGTSIALIEQAAKSDCVLTLQLLTEFFSATTRKRLLRPQDAGALVSDWLAVFPVAPNAAIDLVEAMQVLEGYRISFWDAMLLGHGSEGRLFSDPQRGFPGWTGAPGRPVHQPVSPQEQRVRRGPAR